MITAISQNRGTTVRLLKESKAISTFVLIILMLCSLVFGALLSYMWVMSNYYNMPEDATLLIVTDAVFPVNDATYFNATILNPSNSITDVNITAIRLSVEGRDEVYDINETEPEPLPFSLKRGTEQTFKCKKNWSNFAGETVRIEPVAANASTKSYSYTTPRVRLNLTPTFDESKSVEYFNLTIENSADSVINLTLSEIMVFGQLINENVTPPLTPSPVLSPGQSETFGCNYNWENLREENVTITVKTAEGYESVYITNELPGAVLHIDEIKFDYTDTTYFNLTISSSEYSTTAALLDRVNLTLTNETAITLNTIPPLHIIQIPLPQNQSLTIKCLWDWNAHRNETITVTLYTHQGFTAPSKTVITPPAIVWDITDAKFDLDYTEYFSVNVTNMPCSLQDINVTRILLGGNETIMDPPFEVLTKDTQVMFNCSLPWAPLIGKSVTLIVIKEDGLNVSRSITISSVGLKLLGKPSIGESLGPYVNITISNSKNSLQNVTITKIIFETENRTDPIDGTLTLPRLAPDGYILKIGETITVVCRWDWDSYLAESLKVTVYTAEEFHVSETWYAPFNP